MAATIDERVAELERANAELRQQLDACSAELKEARDQQTATAEVLQVINSSPGDLAPVFDAILEKAYSLCDAAGGDFVTFDGEFFRSMAMRGMTERFGEMVSQQPYRLHPEHPVYSLVRGEKPFVHAADLVVDWAALLAVDPMSRAAAEQGGVRTVLMVPLRKDSALLGIIVAQRREVRPFSDEQIALLQNFAVQAVIAMENARLLTETREALDQQTATAEVLQVINSSPGDLAPVFDAMIERATRLCEADLGTLWTFDGDRFHPAGGRGYGDLGPGSAFEGVRPTPKVPLGRLVAGESIVHVVDAASDPAFQSDDVARTRTAIAGTRSSLTVALRKDDVLLGAITTGRKRVQPYSDQQIALLQNFAAQAVIAMENARLITETREALEQQTATAEVLQVINSSPGDLAPVFDAMLGKARRLCEAELGLLLIYEGDCFRAVSLHGAPEAYVEFMTREPIRPRPNTGLERLVRQQRLVHIADLSAEQAYRERDPLRVASVELAGMRTFLAVPLVKEEALLGAFVLYRQEVRPFTDKQIALLQNFAAQAVIAMENARLLTETREALEQQTATAEVLQVINSSPGDLAPVFDAILDKAHSRCDVAHGSLQLYDGVSFRAVATHGVSDAFADILRQGYRAADSPASRGLIEGRRFVQIADCAEIDHPVFRSAAELAGIRTVLFVPLCRDDALLGLISSARREVRPFSDKEIVLLENFAAQAVIAMENARLLTETREALEQQTATAEVLGVINSSPGDLAPVFNAMLEKALRLCEASFGVLCTYDETSFRAVALRGVPAAYAEFLTAGPLRPGPGNGLTRVAAGEKVVHVVDLAAEDVYRSGETLRRALVDLGGARSALTVALLKDELLLGAFIIYRGEVRAFTDKQIALLQNFAAQAVIAMENARLLTETREALEQQTATAEVLQVINSSPGHLAPVFDAILEKAHNLCNSDHGTLFLRDGAHFRPAAIRGVAEPIAERLCEGLGPDAPVVRPLLAGEHFVHILDLAQLDHPLAALSSEAVVHALLSVPLRKGDELLGMIVTARFEAGAFSQKQIALLQNFAAQAVIAMENARLLIETREALEQQTATAEVLGVINSSPGDVQPTFDAIATSATRLCEAASGAVFRFDGSQSHLAAHYNCSPAELDALRATYPLAPSRGSVTGRAILTRAVTHVADIATDPEYALPSIVQSGMHAHLSVPMLLDGNPIGAITVARREAKQFSETQIELLKTFAAQAVIAMENARLITETREALEQQTATAEVLQVINSSPGDLAPVFDAILEKAHTLCAVAQGALELYDGETFRGVATRGLTDIFAEKVRQGYRSAENPISRGLLGGAQFIHIPDLAEIDHPMSKAAFEIGGLRTSLFVPLRKDNRLLGQIVASRAEVRPFSDKQIALLQNFAAQAVIAMENARLLTETREALEQQTATAEVLQVINSSPGDLAPVFDAMLEKAMRLCEVDIGALWTYDGEMVQAAAVRGAPPQLTEFLRQGPRRPSAPQRWLMSGERVVQITDITTTRAYRDGDPLPRALADVGDVRTFLAVPLRKDDTILGNFAIYRRTPRLFSEKQIALLQNFAAQAVIAMENAGLITETREALEQQTATAEVLQVINSSPGDLAPVFGAILEKAHTLCGAAHGALMAYEGEHFRAVAMQGMPEKFAELLRQPFRPSPGGPQERLLRGERLIHIPDAAVREQTTPIALAAVEAGERTVLFVPLRKDDALLGYITAHRKEVRPFADKEIALIENFAAQAVIAMENARLLNELRQRTHDLQESLEYQTATSDVLKVISRSTFDLDAVMEAVVTSAIRLCRADHAGIYRNENGEYRWAGGYAPTSAYEEHERDLVILPGPGTVVGRAALEGHAVQIADAWSDPLYEAKDDAREGGVHTMLGVPLLREGTPIGVIGLARRRVEHFTDKQIELVTTFADQAVIAIENARLFNELRERTHDLQESLEYQTATSDVLKVISRSTFDLAPVLQTVLDTAIRLCGNTRGLMFRREEDGVYRLAVSSGAESEYIAREASQAIRPGPDTLVGRTVLAGRPVQIIDAMSDLDYALKEEARVGQLRTMLGVPLLREGVPIGVICTARTTVEPFTETQIALVTTFADQAVIAIENARLFNELRERTAELGRSVEELKMLSEVGRAVSSTLDLSAVLWTILTASLGMTWATAGAIFRYIRAERAFRLVEAVGWDEALLGSVGDLSIAETETAMSEAATRRIPIQLADLAELPSTRLRDASLAAGLRSVLIVLLVGPERIFGALVLQRREAGEFPAETVRLMQTLASQSVLAIQNARLFREIADKSEQLALASQHKSQFLANMSHELRTPLNAILGYAELLVDGIYGVLPEKAQGVLERVQNNGKHLLALINDVLDLAKIEAGQLALTLEDYALAEVVRSVVAAAEPLAAAKGLKFTAVVQDGMPMAHGDARRVSQVLLNLAGNAIKFTDAGEVEINASAVNGQFVLTVRDTGPGIADADQDRIFGEFQQIDNSDTRKKGGTGLGLAISKRMVEMQGGLISVESVPGAGSTFRVVLPVHVEPALEEAA